MSLEKLPLRSHLLEDIEDDDTRADLCSAEIVKQWRRRFYILLSIAVVVVGVSNAVTFGCFTSQSSDTSGDKAVRAPWSPANDYVKFENRFLDADPNMSKFLGKPRPEQDQAWHELLEGTFIRITGDELHQADNTTSVRHKKGGYVAGLGVSHALHCLKRVRQYIYADYFYGHEEQDWPELEHHMDHCLESLRQSIMCSADPTMYTLVWTSHSTAKPSVQLNQAHKCTNFEYMHEWMKGRSASANDFVHPYEFDKYVERPDWDNE